MLDGLTVRALFAGARLAGDWGGLHDSAKTGVNIMRKRHRLGRFVILLTTGGCLLQVVGCVAGLAPTIVSYAESAALRGLLGWLVGW